MEKELRLWLDQASEDLDNAYYNLEGKRYALAALLCQQSIEKALKALFIRHFKEVPKVHDVVFLARKLTAPPSLIDWCRKISPYYVQSRYPDAQHFRSSNTFTVTEARDAVRGAKEVLAWVQKQLS